MLMFHDCVYCCILYLVVITLTINWFTMIIVLNLVNGRNNNDIVRQWRRHGDIPLPSPPPPSPHRLFYWHKFYFSQNINIIVVFVLT